MYKLESGHAQTQTLDSLTFESNRADGWRDLRRRIGRTAGLDSQLNLKFDASNERMNTLLETYFHLLQGAVILEPIEIPIKHTDKTYPAIELSD